MAHRQHEKDVCAAAINVLAQRGSGPISFINYPDTIERTRPAVEMLLQGPSCRYVLEHTQIESYQDQKLDDRQFLDLLEPLETKLKDRLPVPGRYDLYVGARAVRGATQTEHIRRLLADWIVKTAPTLEIGSPQTAPHHFCRATVPGVPFEVTLYRWGNGDDRFRIGRHTATLSLPKERRHRILTALDRKCGKLYRAREAEVSAGFICESVLVLETDDIALANASIVSHATVAGIRWMQQHCPQHVPDHVLLADTCSMTWALWVVKKKNLTFPSAEAGLLLHTSIRQL